ncbi:MAG TPA: VWA domain-containing protein [Cyclobacteriaceae bacterium]|nr:VWA domain-containing protein [Cyclobacteriaceae bacterium]
MVTFRDLGIANYVAIALFVILYVVYLVRVIRIARVLHTPYGTVAIKLVIRTIFFALLIIAFVGPSYGDSKREVQSVGKDIMICVDLSKSMDAFDIQPSRLEKVKFEMKRVVQAFSSDRIGIIIFSSEAFMQCPLTYDQNALNLFIETMNTGLVPATGTDFAPPLRMALAKLDDEENGGPNTSQKSKVIVLISDGEDFGEETSDIVKNIEDRDIKLFTLGIGTEEGSPIGTQRGYKTDKYGKTVVSKINPGSMKTLASQTGGQYFEINDSRNEVSKLINTINKIEGELRDARFVDVSANRYYYFLLGALILLVFDVLVNVKTVTI